MSIGVAPGTVHVVNPITTSGHSLRLTMLASEFLRVINLFDPKLDGLASRSEFFSQVPHEAVKAMKLGWHLDFLDLGFFDKTASVFYVLKQSHI